MRRRIEALADRFDEFVSEDAHDALVIQCTPDAVAMVAAAVDLREQRGTLDISFYYVEPFQHARALVVALSAQIASFAQSAALGELPQRGESLRDLVDQLAVLREQASARGDVRCVLWICPSRVHDTDEYVDLAVGLSELTRGTRRGVRVAFRDIDGVIREAMRARGIPVVEAEFDMSPHAMREDLAASAADPAVPLDDRMAATMSVAVTDAAAGGDVGAALRTLADVEAHFAARGVGGHQATAAMMSAQVLALAGDVPRARARALDSIAIALAARVPVAIVTCAACAGDLAMRDDDPFAAEPYFRLALATACGARALPTAVEIGVRLGDALMKSDRANEAHLAWGEALALARITGVVSLARDPAERLRAFYEGAGLTREAHATSELLEALGPAPCCAHSGHS